MINRKFKKAEVATKSTLDWILYLALAVAGVLVFRLVFLKISS